jgi:hypothetical protein
MVLSGPVEFIVRAVNLIQDAKNRDLLLGRRDELQQLGRKHRRRIRER